MTKKWKWIVLLIVAGVGSIPLLIMCALMVWWALPCDPPGEIAQVDVGNNRLVKFYADSCWEVSRNVSYEVQDNGQTIIPRTSLGNHSAMNFTFKAVSAEDASLAAVYTPFALDYDAIFIMIDFGAREAWRSGEYSEGKAKGLELFQRLKQANPDLPEPKELLR